MGSAFYYQNVLTVAIRLGELEFPTLYKRWTPLHVTVSRDIVRDVCDSLGLARPPYFNAVAESAVLVKQVYV